MTLIGGLPAHPLIIHAVVVLLPLAALGSLLLALRPAWRRRFGVVVLLITVAGVGAVPLAVATGEQLHAVLGDNPLIIEHEHRADTLLPYAIAFGMLVLATVLLGYRADVDGAGVGLRRVTIALSVLAFVAGAVVTGLVVWIGDAGSQAVWQGVVR